jgi:SAM-dependent methyltransferase
MVFVFPIELFAGNRNERMKQEKFEAYSRLAYASVYSEPEEGNFHNSLIKKSVQEFVPLFGLQTTAFVLDAGCGPGVFMDEIRSAGFSAVWGVTMSEEDVEASKRKGHKCQFADISDLPFGDSVMDLVWCRHAIEHSPYPLFTLFEFNRVLKDGGGLYIEVPAPDLPRAHESNPNHHSVLGRKMWLALMQRAGFEVFGARNIQLELVMRDGSKVPEVFYTFMAKKFRSIIGGNKKKP